MILGMLMSVVYFLCVTILVLILVALDMKINPSYNLGDEIRKGNAAVGLSVAGKFIGLGVIAMSAIAHNSGFMGIFYSMVWTAFGAVLQIVGGLIFEVVTPKLAVGKELAAGNRAVGLVSMGIGIGLSLIISASISG